MTNNEKVRGRAGDPGAQISSELCLHCLALFFLCVFFTPRQTFSKYFFLEALGLHLTKLATLLSAEYRILEKSQYLMDEKDTSLIFQNVNSVIKEMISE